MTHGHPFITEHLLDARRRDLLAAAESARMASRARAREHRSLRGHFATAVRGLATRPRRVVFEPCEGEC